MNIFQFQGPNPIFCPRCEQEISTPDELSRAARILVITSPNKREEYQLGATLTIGRDPGNNLQILDGQVSRKHAQILRKENHFVVHDLGSRNGTFLNGEKITNDQVLTHMDHLKIGTALLKFYDHGRGKQEEFTFQTVENEPAVEAEPIPSGVSDLTSAGPRPLLKMPRLAGPLEGEPQIAPAKPARTVSPPHPIGRESPVVVSGRPELRADAASPADKPLSRPQAAPSKAGPVGAPPPESPFPGVYPPIAPLKPSGSPLPGSAPAMAPSRPTPRMPNGAAHNLQDHEIPAPALPSGGFPVSDPRGFTQDRAGAAGPSSIVDGGSPMVPPVLMPPPYPSSSPEEGASSFGAPALAAQEPKESPLVPESDSALKAPLPFVPPIGPSSDWRPPVENDLAPSESRAPIGAAGPGQPMPPPPQDGLRQRSLPPSSEAKRPSGLVPPSPGVMPDEIPTPHWPETVLKSPLGGVRELKPTPVDRLVLPEQPEPRTEDILAEVDVTPELMPGKKIQELHDLATIKNEYQKVLYAFRVNEELKNILSLPKLLKRAMELIFELLSPNRGAILLLNDRGQLEPNIVKRRDGIDSLEDIRLSKTLLRRAQEERKSILTTDALLNVGTQSVVMENIKSAMTVPLIAKGKLLGIVHVDSSTGVGGSFSKEDLEILTGIGTQIALAIADATLQKKIEREVESRRRLERYISPGLVDQILTGQDDPTKGGRNQKATVLFSDLRGFTAMSERMTPEEVVTLLNEYFELMVDIVFKYSGTLDKFIGDALMAIWGVPLPTENDPLNAVKAALDMQTEVAHFNLRRRERGEEPIAVGIGINSGALLAGNIGSSKRMEYTVIGDTVNVASRICGVARAEILISHDTYKEICPHVKAEELPTIKLKGKSEEVAIYRILGLYQDPYGQDERRRHPRLKVAFSVSCSKFGESDEHMQGTVDNISQSGMALQVEMKEENAFKMGDLLSFAFQTPDGDQVVGLVGTIVAIKYSCNSRSNVYYDLHIRFKEVSDQTLLVLKRLVGRESPGASGIF